MEGSRSRCLEGLGHLGLATPARRGSSPRQGRGHRRRATLRKLKLLRGFPRIDYQIKQLIAGISKGHRVLLLRLRIIELLHSYASITVRMVFYRLVSLYNYPNDRSFYKRLGYSLKRLRKLFPEVNEKFEDPTRPVRGIRMPNPKLELWLEKLSLEFFLRRLAEKYHVPTLAERGFGSITMFHRAVERAARRGVRKILFISDHDPSGLKIEEVTRREMSIHIERIALTMEQIRKYRLPSIRVKRKDSRAKRYIAKFGDNAWEVEALPPRVLLRIVEEKLTENIPEAFLEELRLKEEAEKVTRPFERRLIEEIRSDAVEMKREGVSDAEILRRLREKYGAGRR